MAPEQLIAQARLGDADVLGRLLEPYRNYLRLLAGLEIGRHLQGKVDASDVVQEAFLEAHRHFDRFEGTSEAQLVHWLRKVLAGRLGNLLRRYLGTQGRDVRREQTIAADLDRSSVHLVQGPFASLSTPSQQAQRREQAVMVADALARLPEDYRAVLLLRHWEGLPFTEVARRLERSEDAAEKLWVRALARLRKEMGGPP